MFYLVIWLQSHSFGFSCTIIMKLNCTGTFWQTNGRHEQFEQSGGESKWAHALHEEGPKFYPWQVLLRTFRWQYQKRTLPLESCCQPQWTTLTNGLSVRQVHMPFWLPVRKIWKNTAESAVKANTETNYSIVLCQTFQNRQHKYFLVPAVNRLCASELLNQKVGF